MWRRINRKFAKRITTNTLHSQIISLPNHPFPKGTYHIVGDAMLAKIDESCLQSTKQKAKVWYFTGVRTDDMYDNMKPLMGNYRVTSFCTLEQMRLLIIHQGKCWIKFLSWKRIHRRNYQNAKSLFQDRLNDTTMGKHL